MARRLTKKLPMFTLPMMTLSIFLVGLALSNCGGSSGGPLEIKLGHVANPGSLVALSAEEFARRANAKLGQRAKVVVFGSSQLGNDEILLQKLKLGTVQLSLPSTIMSSAVDAFGFFEMPYLVKDREHMSRIAEEIFWPKLAPLAEAEGYRVLGLWENGFRHITSNTRPIEKPEDLRGIKLRTPRGRWRIRLFQSYGANPTPMALSEVFVALQTGVMDGQENPLTQIHSSKFHEVQTYLSLTRHVYTPAYLLTGSRPWERLPADVRRVLEETARETEQFVRETAGKLDADLLESLRAAGMKINEPDRESFIQAGQGIYAEFGDAVPGAAEWVSAALALAGP